MPILLRSIVSEVVFGVVFAGAWWFANDVLEGRSERLFWPLSVAPVYSFRAAVKPQITNGLNDSSANVESEHSGERTQLI